MILRPNEQQSEDSFGQSLLEIFQDAISPSWLMQVIKGTSIVLIILILLAFAI